MGNSGRRDPCFPIGAYELDKSDLQCSPAVGPSMRRVKEAIVPPTCDLVEHLSPAHELDSLDVGHSENSSSGPSCPPGFELPADGVGPSFSAQAQHGVLESPTCGKSLELDSEVEQSSSYSHVSESALIRTQTPPYESVPTFHSGAIEIVLPFEEELVEAQKAWNIGKALGLSTSNDLCAIEAISKIKECQDFTLPRKRSRQRKKIGGY